MDNQSYSNDENNKWVEERVAKLTPPHGWKPDTDRAFERVMQRVKPAALSPAIRLTMAAVTLVVVGVVFALLPWQMLWAPEAIQTTVTAQQPDKPALEPPPQVPSASPIPAPAEPTETQINPPPTPPPAPRPNRKKDPRLFASAAEQTGRELMQRAALPEESRQAAALGQEPQQPGGVTEPVIISQVQPAYTPEAREARIQGTVELVATVRDDGTVKVDRITRSLGYGLDEAAAAAVEKWKFAPATKDGKPVAAITTILVSFSLR